MSNKRSSLPPPTEHRNNKSNARRVTCRPLVHNYRNPPSVPDQKKGEDTCCSSCKTRQYKRNQEPKPVPCSLTCQPKKMRNSQTTPNEQENTLDSPASTSHSHKKKQDDSPKENVTIPRDEEIKVSNPSRVFLFPFPAPRAPCQSTTPLQSSSTPPPSYRLSCYESCRPPFSQPARSGRVVNASSPIMSMPPRGGVQ